MPHTSDPITAPIPAIIHIEEITELTGYVDDGFATEDEAIRLALGQQPWQQIEGMQEELRHRNLRRSLEK